MTKFFERDPRRKIYLILIIICLAGLYFTAKHFLKSDEDLIREAVKRTARAVEKKDIEAISEVISPRYRGYYESSKEDAVARAREELAEAQKLRIKIDHVEIKIRDRQADVICYFFASGYYSGSSIYNAIPFKGIMDNDPSTPDRADIILEKDADQWLVYQFEIHSPWAEDKQQSDQ